MLIKLIIFIGDSGLWVAERCYRYGGAEAVATPSD